MRVKTEENCTSALSSAKVSVYSSGISAQQKSFEELRLIRLLSIIRKKYISIFPNNEVL